MEHRLLYGWKKLQFPKMIVERYIQIGESVISKSMTPNNFMGKREAHNIITRGGW